MARSAKPRIGTQDQAISQYLNSSDSDTYNCFALFASLQFRNSTNRQFKINRMELWALFSLHGYLIFHNKVLISQAEFIGHLSGNFRTKKKIEGYITGLLTLKCIGSFEYTKSPGSLSIGITDFGFEVLKYNWHDMNRLFHRYNEAQKVMKEPVKYPNLSVDRKSISAAENIPEFYRSYQKTA